MTGFGTASMQLDLSRGRVDISCEVRSVNSKYLDLSIRSPKTYSALDTEVTKLVRSRLKRGRVDLSYTVKFVQQGTKSIEIHKDQVAKLYNELNRVKKDLGLVPEISITDLLKFSDWLEVAEPVIDAQIDWPGISSVLDKALSSLIQSREIEGKSLEGILTMHRKDYETLYSQFAARSDSMLSAVRERFKERMKTFSEIEKLDPHRLEQELTFWIGRADFREEVDRIRQHLVTFDQILKSSEGETCRKLEFLVQELQRETNTLGSKCPDAGMTPVVVEMKAAIERIREQLQNGE